MTFSQLVNYFNNNGLYSIELDGRSVGYIAFRKILEEAELDQIVIDEQYRNQKLGYRSLLLWHQQLVSNNVKKVFLEVRLGNDPAIRLYQALSYQRIGVRKNYYRVKDQFYDALLMELVL
ncbi:GNAT family N-acetyltransferase [Reinekea sp. G2M2-21]|uniref:GNAT family N-acetyltransferase n=1 Tax=Reinekea sp. G2M2-21 TaxID=2788942 RepID=UPI0018AB0D68